LVNLLKRCDGFTQAIHFPKTDRRP
jgi:hypothetical protein